MKSLIYILKNSEISFSPPATFPHHRFAPGWKVCQLRTECKETDNILCTKNEINVRKIEIARDGPIPIFYDSVL